MSNVRSDTPSGDTTAVEVSHLYKVFGRRTDDVLKGLDDGKDRSELQNLGTAAVIDAGFEVKRGEIFVVMGLSGSGKSTLIRCLNGLNPITRGSVKIYGTEVNGLDGDDLRELRRARMSMVFQHFALLPHRTVLENVAYGLEISKVPEAERKETARKWLDRVGLTEWADSMPDELSGGMQQRVGLARAFAADNEILLMDEAFSALDPLIRHEMQELLVELQEELGKTIIFITHDLNEAMFVGDRIAVMRAGHIVQVGTPNDILTDPANDYVAKFVQDVDRAKVLTAADVMEGPRAVVRDTSGSRGALRVMRDLQTPTVFVISHGRKVVGYVQDTDVLRAVRAGNTDISSILQPLPAKVTADQYLSELFELTIHTRLPIAVVGNNDRLLGVVPRIALLAALADTDAEADLTISPQRMVPVEVLDATLNDTSGEEAHS
ncbi:MAG: quaternary amine ABC transporter ATP-binding protein [Ancrocorticia sp.]|uniref:quaternary amine ABC transporter ATP-binding protein n=1 Tax=Ancrocorticia sp. TaxID=2593684 RepID=UPI003F8E9D7A